MPESVARVRPVGYARAVVAWHHGGSGLTLALRRFLGRFEVRLFLSACIVVSLLPLAEVRDLDRLFLLIFGVEFVLRAAVVFRTGDDDADERGWRWPLRGALLLLLFDLLALISFLPLAAHDTPWMRLLRVIRLIALLSYWAPVMQDLRAVLLRRERSRQVLVMGAMVGLLSFIGALALEQLEAGAGEVDYDDDGQVTHADRRFFVHLWWAFRQIQDPGNMLSAPGSAPAVVVSVVLTVFGLLLVSFLIGLGTDVVREVMTVSHLRSPGLAGHTVIVHDNAATGQLLHELVRYYQKLIPEGSLSRRWLRQLGENARRVLQGPRYVVVGRSDERPAFLRRPDLARIVYRPASAADPDFMLRADVARAQRVVVLADLEAQNPDAETIRALLMIHDALRSPAAEPPQAAARTLRPSQRGPTAPRPSDGHHTHNPGRLLIAEVLDERNLPAAWAALDYGAGELRSFVVLIERLVNLLLACVARIDGVGPVLEELLTTHGHELYTCFFAAIDEKTPALRLPEAHSAAMAAFRARAFNLPARRFLAPIGMICEYRDPQGFTSRKVVLGVGDAASDAAIGEQQWTGVVAVAPNFAVLRDLCEDMRVRPGAAGYAAAEASVEASEAAGCPGLIAEPQLPLRRILVCGFRPATVGLLEALVLAEPAAQILVLLDDEDALVAATERFREHRSLAEYRMLTLSPGSFVAQDDGSFVYQPRLHAGLRCGNVRLAVGDRSSLLQFVDLPHGFGHAGDLDLALLLATRREDGDARTTQSLLALEVARTRGDRRSPLRVVAEVVDADLCARLRRRTALRGDTQVQIYALERLRAAFLFQSVLIPAFNLVYGELMGPWGQSFARKRVDAAGRGSCTFQALAQRFVAEGELLLGVERRRADGQVVVDLAGGEGNGGRVDLATLVAVWVLAPDPSEIRRGSCVDGPVA
jgi:hypothetical protein